MLIRDSLSINSVELAPTGYQFREELGDDSSANRLLVSGTIQNGRGQWTAELADFPPRQADG